MQYYFIAVGLRWLPRWQHRCYRASCQLCSNYLLYYVLLCLCALHQTSVVSWQSYPSTSF